MEAAVIRHLSTPDVAFALPRAAGGTWYAARAVDPLTDQTRAELALSLRDLGQVLAELGAKAPALPLLLAGFSQGACLSLELAFTGAAAEALVAFTGCRVGTPQETRPQALSPGLPVYLSAGDADPWIPVTAFAEAVADLGVAGARLRADVFPARPHEVSRAEIAVLDAVLADLTRGHAPRMEAQR
jgi:phospholipase/carboxylesterase